MITTLQIDTRIKEKLDALKIHPRESYNEVIRRIVEECKNSKIDEESLKETIDILSDPETLKDIAEALIEYEKKGGTSLKQVRKELGV